MKHWVIDTNVVLSAMLVPGSNPALVLAAAAKSRVIIVYDTRILAEYRDVLNRPQFKLSPRIIANFLADLRFHQLVTPSRRLHGGPDPDDLMFIEVALETPHKTIVTGNPKDYPRSIRHGVRILSPKQAFAEI